MWQLLNGGEKNVGKKPLSNVIVVEMKMKSCATGGKKYERERERDRQTERETDRQTDRQRQRDKETDRKKEHKKISSLSPSNGILLFPASSS